ncbi:hypothetical protein R1flu_010267 [Riccia fluitans]|uniref:Uncharacterized protein n=1 Tax=Riccia fluitans TaxID=41844 RepID=A0ABD1Z5A6_9MARC
MSSLQFFGATSLSKVLVAHACDKVVLRKKIIILKWVTGVVIEVLILSLGSHLPNGRFYMAENAMLTAFPHNT